MGLTSPYDSDFIAVIRLYEGKSGISTSKQHYFLDNLLKSKLTTDAREFTTLVSWIFYISNNT